MAIAKEVLSLGIDAESNEPLPDHGRLDLISSHEERVRLRELAAETPGTSWDQLLTPGD